MFPVTRHVIARIGIGFALFIGVPSLFTSFVPGAGASVFGVAAASASLGLLSPSWRLRIASVVLAVGLTWLAWNDYQHGLRHREWLRQQGLAFSGPQPQRLGSSASPLPL